MGSCVPETWHPLDWIAPCHFQPTPLGCLPYDTNISHGPGRLLAAAGGEFDGYATSRDDTMAVSKPGEGEESLKRHCNLTGVVKQLDGLVSEFGASYLKRRGFYLMTNQLIRRKFGHPACGPCDCNLAMKEVLSSSRCNLEVAQRAT